MNKIIKCCLALGTIGILSVTNLIAQTDKYVDRVQLTNGSILWGLSEIEGEQLKLFLTSEDSVILPVSQIRSLKKGRLNPGLYQDRLLGVYYQVAAGVLVGKSYQFSENKGTFSASFVSGYKFNQLWGLGLGMGVDYYPEQRHIPLFVEVQGDLLKGRITPFYQLRTGWSWGEDRRDLEQIDAQEGGFYIQPSVGVKWHFAGHSYHLQLSYVRQEATTRYQPIDFGNGQMVTNVEDRVLQRIGISTGISF